MRNKIINILLLPLIALLLGCNISETPNNIFLKLNVEDVSCKEAWLKISGTKGDNLTLKRDDKEIKSFTLNASDSMIVDDSLQPNRSYIYQLLKNNNIITESSEKVSATTMDTTSHNFTWQSWEFGESEYSALYDVAIINENNIWAVGEIYMNDSLGNPDPEQYAVAHWDGSEWKLMKLKFNCRLYFPNCGPETNLIATSHSIYARSPNDIWVAAETVHHFDGTKWTEEGEIIGAGSASKIWGTSEVLWFVGSSGFIAKRNENGSWQKIESGTNTIITDIWGIVNENDEAVTYCTVSSFFEPGDKKLLKIKENKVESVLWDQDRLLYSVWTNSTNYLYVCGEGVFENKMGRWKEIDLPKISTNCIRGNGMNDIFIAGDFGIVCHYNGINWKVYDNNFNGGYGKITVKGNNIAIVGQKNGKGIITIGKRN